MRLKNKVVVITGGLGLIGSNFAETVLNAGGIAVVADINKTKFNAFYSRFSEYKQNLHCVELDITNNESIENLINYLSKKYGKIDALVNNAYPHNKNYGRKLENVEYADFSDNISMNLGGYFLMSKYFCNYFVKQGFGNIINISSIYGVIAPRFEIYDSTQMTMPIEYSVIKSGLIHMTKYMAKYFKGKNIRFNCISPGGVFDNQDIKFVEKYNSFCLNKGMISPQDLNGILIFLLSDESMFINGQNIIVDDGFTL